MPPSKKLQITNKAQLEKALSAELKKKVVKTFKQVIDDLYITIRNLIRDGIKNTAVYRDISGELGGQLGFLDGRQRLNEIIDELAESIIIELEEGNDRVDLIIRGVKSDYSNILSLEVSAYTTPEGQLLEWLEWLLFEGTRPIVFKYHFSRGNSYSQSRTGLGVMKPTGNWAIPAKWAGIQDNNFIIEGISSVEVEIKAAVLRAFRTRARKV